MDLRSAHRGSGTIILEPKGQEPIQAKMVIDASGANSWFSRHFAGLQNLPTHNCAGVRAYYSGVSGLDEDGFIELHFIKEALPGYFWIFPLPNGGANVGLGMRSDLISKQKVDLKQLMKDVIEKAPDIRERFAGAKLEGPIKGFPLPLGSKRQKLSGDNYLLVGDAAHLIDPFTGEGISNAMISGAYAAEVCANALNTQDFSADHLKEYDEKVYKRLGQELSLSYKLQRLAKQPRLFNLVVNKALKNETLSRTISSMFDDMDLREELRKPSFYYKILFG
jgi:flavin-dependent dehydrogenase